MKIITNKDLIKNFKRVGDVTIELDESQYHVFISCNEIYEKYLKFKNVTNMKSNKMIEMSACYRMTKWYKIVQHFLKDYNVNEFIVHVKCVNDILVRENGILYLSEALALGIPLESINKEKMEKDIKSFSISDNKEDDLDEILQQGNIIDEVMNECFTENNKRKSEMKVSELLEYELSHINLISMDLMLNDFINYDECLDILNDLSNITKIVIDDHNDDLESKNKYLIDIIKMYDKINHILIKLNK